MPRPKFTSPARLKRLGAVLRALRVASELTAEQAARDLGWSGSKVSRIETGSQLALPDDVRKLAGLYGVGEDEIQKYVTIARQARQRDWWHKYDDVLQKRPRSAPTNPISCPACDGVASAHR